MTMKTQVSEALQRIEQQIGEGVSDLSFQLSIEGDTIRLGPERFDLSVTTEADGRFVFAGQWRDIIVRWEFLPWENGYWVTLKAEGGSSLNCSTMDSLVLRYRPACADFAEWRVPGRGRGFEREGVFQVKELAGGEDRGPIGVFRDSRSVGLLAATRIPQRHIHEYTIQQDEGDQGVMLTGTTQFVEGFRQCRQVASETTWVCASKAVGNAIETYATHIPRVTPAPQPPVGWNSWDYYDASVSLDDMIENMEEIRKAPVLTKHVKYVAVDDGWQVVWGEWYANHRFPGGIERLAEEIRSRGFTPGIWTAPLCVHKDSKIALRQYEFLVKDEYGDPQGTEFAGHYIVDPTHPLGQEFLREIYTRLFKAGFRYYKLDFVSSLLAAKRLYAPEKSPYDALRDLFTLVRECAGTESHILGCSLPAECGPGYSDSGRIGIDIHNKWTHLVWQTEGIQVKYWLHNRIWGNDPDFLVVRGRDTSLEAETNVLNPKAHNPNPPRWRRGPVFTLDEARTWANLVMLSGGSVFLGDRIGMLNEAGKALVYKVLEESPTGLAARPLDLCDGDHASLWLQELAREMRLGIINWADETQEKQVSFEEWGLAAPAAVTDLWTGDTYTVRSGGLSLTLSPHQSVLVTWPRR